MANRRARLLTHAHTPTNIQVHGKQNTKIFSVLEFCTRFLRLRCSLLLLRLVFSAADAHFTIASAMYAIIIECSVFAFLPANEFHLSTRRERKKRTTKKIRNCSIRCE